MIRVQLAELLRRQGKTYYRLSKETGVAHQVFLRLLKGRTTSITFRALEAICMELDCTPSDLLVVMPDEENKSDAAGTEELINEVLGRLKESEELPLARDTQPSDNPRIDQVDPRNRHQIASQKSGTRGKD